jgi:hypothetical protein
MTCGTHRRGKCAGFWESLKETDHLEDQGIDDRIGSEWILVRLARRDVEWIWLAQDRGQWRALVNTVMICWFWWHVVS